VTSVVITRRRNPLEGLALRVLGPMHRHGRLELLLVLPDGSKSLIPAAWTDLPDADGEADGEVAATLGSLADLLAACAVVAVLSDRAGRDRLPCSHRPRRTPMQAVSSPFLGFLKGIVKMSGSPRSPGRPGSSCPSLTHAAIRVSRLGSARAAVVSCSRPGRTSDIHNGHPSGADTTWMLPP
jgi:hypothetical protein